MKTPALFVASLALMSGAHASSIARAQARADARNVVLVGHTDLNGNGDGLYILKYTGSVPLN